MGEVILMKSFSTPSPESRVQKKAMHIAHTIKDQNKESIPSDIAGSYTGESRREESPEQDADDL